MRAKYKSVFEISCALKRSKRTINRVLARDNDIRWEFHSRRRRVTTLRIDCHIRNLALSDNYSLSQIFNQRKIMFKEEFGSCNS